MEQSQAQVRRLAAQFQRCQKTLAAIGDPTRQQIVLALLSGGCGGVRVGEVTAKSHLSRPAVSHHLGILREAGLISVRRGGDEKLLLFRRQPVPVGRDAGAVSACQYLIANAVNQKPTEENEI